jgi:hypothetical protein
MNSSAARNPASKWGLEPREEGSEEVWHKLFGATQSDIFRQKIGLVMRDKRGLDR